MTKNHLITVIIPVYNVAPYLRRCLDSVINQTYSNIEILLVDDGSSDDSGKICDEYEAADSRVHVIHKINGGVSSARNIGLDEAHGEYVAFIDSDDVIEKDMLERTLANAVRYNVQISCCLLDVVEIDGTSRHLADGIKGVVPSKEVISNYFSDQFTKDQMYGPCNKLMKYTLLQGHRFRQYRLGEDILFMFELLLACDRVYYDDYVGYHYMHREGSAMTSSFSRKRLDYIDAGKHILNLCRQHAEYALSSAEIWLYSHVLVTLRQIMMSGKKSEYEDFFNVEKQYLKVNRRYLARLGMFRKLDYYGIMHFPLYFKILKQLKK